MNLYSTYAKSFSNTRQFAWEGWKKILQYLDSDLSLRILDLGSGNSRFLEFLLKNNFQIEKYVGIDSSEELIDIAKQKFEDFENAEFILTDLEKNDWVNKLNCKFDLIVIFGVMHHIKSFNTRKRILKDSFSLLSNQGLHITTYWQFANNKDFLKKHVIKSKIKNKKTDLFSENDYTLKFGNDGATRFAHHFTDNEIKQMYTDVHRCTFEQFQSDGFENKMNKYILCINSDNID